MFEYNYQFLYLVVIQQTILTAIDNLYIIHADVNPVSSVVCHMLLTEHFYIINVIKLIRSSRSCFTLTF